jgi:hypothetical protein
MRFSTVATGLLLPLLAVADTLSGTLTSTATMTRTVIVSEIVASVTSTYTSQNATTSSTSSSASINSTTTSTWSTSTTTYCPPTSIGTISMVAGTGSTTGPVMKPTSTSTLIPVVGHNGAASLNSIFAGSASVLVMVAAALL